MRGKCTKNSVRLTFFLTKANSRLVCGFTLFPFCTILFSKHCVFSGRKRRHETLSDRRALYPAAPLLFCGRRKRVVHHGLRLSALLPRGRTAPSAARPDPCRALSVSLPLPRKPVRRAALSAFQRFHRARGADHGNGAPASAGHRRSDCFGGAERALCRSAAARRHFADVGTQRPLFRKRVVSDGRKRALAVLLRRLLRLRACACPRSD